MSAIDMTTHTEAAQKRDPNPYFVESVRKELIFRMKNALEGDLKEGEQVFWREPFRWHSKEGVLGNQYDGLNLQTVAYNMRFVVVEDFLHMGIVRPMTFDETVEDIRQNPQGPGHHIPGVVGL